MSLQRQFSVTPAECHARRLASLATRCLLIEANLTPKPGLVDRRGNGAHQDLTLALMERSAQSLTPMFRDLARQSWLRPADIALRQLVGRLGRDGEAAMMQATCGVNTHRGAIWALGLLVSATAMCGGSGSPAQIAGTAARLAQLPDDAAPKQFSNGLRASARYRLPGAREEAQQGFPHVLNLALPQLVLSRNQGAAGDAARLDALMAIMTSLSDTCVLSRAGMAGLTAMQQGARAVLAAGGVHQPAGRQALLRLDAQMLALNASPGGAADLLSAALFLDSVQSAGRACPTPTTAGI
ncbi:triphosphoribosyl-dephospho-CoA synthase [Erwinia sorbitola]|uniref:2-(5''-triphosphoribosyl)-3'-dephosphocoenzyme-A synthase n=1 Tax=Erwinia sorbitola TaxID=2681984 RepID=A0A6I6ENU5_9GAMM|nr:triphosphoribosyl-dephospho-CoA synthase [Erwinia sorbitola]MTD27713.1 triphosphoribosyl-dephospho-CoA synthase [Erwinia sorbitola]QGU86282.1 triphosphoribosyl-dephospho-CoA synthase [Erwinia sorbitola]